MWGKVETMINKVFSNGATSNLVGLNTEQADKFIDTIVDESAVLQKARVVRMNAPKKRIGKIWFGTRLLHPATSGAALDASKRATTETSELLLESQEMIATVKVNDDELEDNVEGLSFEAHLMQMIAKKARNEIEEAGFYAIKDTQKETILQLFDGWFSGAGSITDASDTGVFADRYIDKSKLGKAYKALQTKFRGWVSFMMHDDLGIDYADIIHVIKPYQ